MAEDVRVVGRGRVFDKCTEDTMPIFTSFLDPIAKSDHIKSDVVLLELFGETDERTLGVW